jgi:hypothetical protein
LTPAKHVFAGVTDTSEVGDLYCPVSTTTVMHNVTSVNNTGDAFLTSVVDTGDIMHHRSKDRQLCRCHLHRRSMSLPVSLTPAVHALPVLLIPVMHQ